MASMSIRVSVRNAEGQNLSASLASASPPAPRGNAPRPGDGRHLGGSGAAAHRQPPLPCTRASKAGAPYDRVAVPAGCTPSASTAQPAARALRLCHIHRWLHSRRRPACSRLVRRSGVENSPGCTAAAAASTRSVALSCLCSTCAGDPILLPQGRLGTVFRDPSIVWHGGWFHLAFTTELCVGLQR